MDMKYATIPLKRHTGPKREDNVDWRKLHDVQLEFVLFT